MKQIASSIMLFLFILQLTSCSISETASDPKHYEIILIDNRNNTAKLFIHRGAGKYDEILPVENIYSVDIPAMRGGYSNLFGIKFNKHIPEEYEVLKIMSGEKIIKEISFIEIEQFKKNDKGNYLLTF